MVTTGGKHFQLMPLLASKPSYITYTIDMTLTQMQKTVPHPRKLIPTQKQVLPLVLLIEVAHYSRMYYYPAIFSIFFPPLTYTSPLGLEYSYLHFLIKEHVDLYQIKAHLNLWKYGERKWSGISLASY